MQPVKLTPVGSSYLVQFQGQLLHISQPSIGRISINFDQLSKNLKHQIMNYQLEKINYKTVVGSLKGQHPQILSARLQKNPDELYVLTIKVSYEFLPQTIQTIIFDKREITAQQSDQIAVKNMKNYLENIKQQISSLTNLSALSGQIDNNNNNSPFEIFIKIPHHQTVFTLGINLTKPLNNTYKLQMYYFNSLTKQRKNSKLIPQDGVYVNHNNDSTYIEVRCFAEQQENGYDHVIFQLKDNWKGNYLVMMEKVQIKKN